MDVSRPRTLWSDHISYLGWEHLDEELEEVSVEREVFPHDLNLGKQMMMDERSGFNGAVTIYVWKRTL